MRPLGAVSSTGEQFKGLKFRSYQRHVSVDLGGQHARLYISFLL